MNAGPKFIGIFWIMLSMALVLAFSCTPEHKDHSFNAPPSVPQSSNKAIGSVSVIPKVAVFLDFTSSMKGYFATGDMVDNLAGLIANTKRLNGVSEFWKYGQEKRDSKGSVCLKKAIT